MACNAHWVRDIIKNKVDCHIQGESAQKAQKTGGHPREKVYAGSIPYYYSSQLDGIPIEQLQRVKRDRAT